MEAKTSSNNETFQHPLTSRYCSKEMSFIFSDDKKYKLWRELWYLLAKSQQSLGLSVISSEALEEMKAALKEPIDYALVAEYEAKTHHDVMAHLLVWTKVCPKAGPIIHLGATSCDIVDNAECIIIRDALECVIQKLVGVIKSLAEFSYKWKDTASLGYTHFQPAQLTTVGKRACLWLQDLVTDLETLQQARDFLRFRGLKGATGTQASFLSLFNGDSELVEKLEQVFCGLLGFDNRYYQITGQTTPRKADIGVLVPLGSLAASCSKMCTDIRLLCHSKQLEEGFNSLTQVGSSAMPYKRNPIKSERACSLARYLMNLTNNAFQNCANQWLERSLDDSANRRLSLAESFLTADSILDLLGQIIGGLVVYPKLLQELISKELPFLVTENLLMSLVSQEHKDRQIGHEIIRRLSLEVNQELLNKDGLQPSNDLLSKLRNEPYFSSSISQEKFEQLTNQKALLGRAPEQVHKYIYITVKPLLETKYKTILNI